MGYCALSNECITPGDCPRGTSQSCLFSDCPDGQECIEGSDWSDKYCACRVGTCASMAEGEHVCVTKELYHGGLETMLAESTEGVLAWRGSSAPLCFAGAALLALAARAQLRKRRHG